MTKRQHERRKIPRSYRESCVYLLGVRTVNGTIKTYLGSTSRPHIRLDEHNGHLSGGAKTTYRITRGNRDTLVRICMLRGFTNLTHARSVEKKLKLNRNGITLSMGKGTPAERATRTTQGNPLHIRIRKILILLAQKQWTKRCPLASTCPLTLEWYPGSQLLDMHPISSDQNHSYLPSYVKECDVVNFEKST